MTVLVPNSAFYCRIQTVQIEKVFLKNGRGEPVCHGSFRNPFLSVRSIRQRAQSQGVVKSHVSELWEFW